MSPQPPVRPVTSPPQAQNSMPLMQPQPQPVTQQTYYPQSQPAQVPRPSMPTSVQVPQFEAAQPPQGPHVSPSGEVSIKIR